MIDLGIPQIEICCADPASIAEAAGLVDRVELCSEIGGGGITPSLSAVMLAREAGFRSINVLLRIRSGDFVFSPSEIRAMVSDAECFARHGATGIVVGALTTANELDENAMRTFLQVARDNGMEAVCNRAIDLCTDPVAEVERLIGWGYDRVLTSGGASSAPSGAETLAVMSQLAQGRIVVMAGSGLRPENVAELVAVTGVGAVHSTCHSSCPADGASRHVYPGFGPHTSPYTSREEVLRFIAALSQ